jgi:hypothetical protein
MSTRFNSLTNTTCNDASKMKAALNSIDDDINSGIIPGSNGTKRLYSVDGGFTIIIQKRTKTGSVWSVWQNTGSVVDQS